MTMMVVMVEEADLYWIKLTEKSIQEAGQMKNAGNLLNYYAENGTVQIKYQGFKNTLNKRK